MTVCVKLTEEVEGVFEEGDVCLFGNASSIADSGCIIEVWTAHISSAFGFLACGLGRFAFIIRNTPPYP